MVCFSVAKPDATSPLHIKVIHNYTLSLCQLFPSGKRCRYINLEGTQISELGTGDMLAAAPAVRFRCCPAVQEIRKKSTKNLEIISRNCVCSFLVEPNRKSI